jgi:hypothetical protein
MSHRPHSWVSDASVLCLCCRSAVPALMGSYRTGRTLGIVASSSSLQRAWDSTTTAAASGAPGSYLAFELSTSDDGWSWQPVQFRQSGFAAISSSTAGPVGQEGVLGKVRGVYEPRLQGQLAAAGSGSLEDNSWLLGLADKVLEVRGSRCSNDSRGNLAAAHDISCLQAVSSMRLQTEAVMNILRHCLR